MSVGEIVIVHRLIKAPQESDKDMLHSKVLDLLQCLKKEFGEEFFVKSKPVSIPTVEWSHCINISKGKSIGVEIDLRWNLQTNDILEIEINESTSVGKYIKYGVLIPFMISGFCLTVAKVGPFALIPGGLRIAGAIGACVALIPGSILVYVFRRVLLRDFDLRNKELKKRVEDILIKKASVL